MQLSFTAVGSCQACKFATVFKLMLLPMDFCFRCQAGLHCRCRPPPRATRSFF
ncbi:hypothetical protein [Methanimicrococcus hongohii]|uniref:hypothetical protein n=1 Tax=Methanimicrococcus hongohii TaxID=3028295 RepID=UPI00292F16A9|nr:hypothetical protein [Methanimicrococcus sp. Hf6]